MQRPVWLRALIGIWALCFTAALSEAPGLHVCAVHGGHGSRSASADADGHSMHAKSGHHSTAPSDHSHHAPTGCTCLGMCCCAAPIAVPPTTLAIAADEAVAVSAFRFAEVEAPMVGQDHVRPFANAPPTD